MEKEIKTNCGLVALGNISDFKNISIRTLLNLAEDNGLSLYAYKAKEGEWLKIPLPAIIHTTNHFEYVTEISQINFADFNGEFLSTSKLNFDKIVESECQQAIGGTWVAAAVGTATVTLGAIEYYNANKDKKKAEKLAKEAEVNRPTYGIPESATKGLTELQQRAALGMPEAQRQRYIDQINRANAYALASNVDRGAGIQGVSSAQQNLNDANANLLTMDSQQRQQNINNYVNWLNNYAQYEDKAFAYNKDMPYQRLADSARALYGSSKANENTALQTITSGVNTGMSGIGTTNNQDNPQNNPPPTQYYNSGYQGYSPYGGTYNTSPPQQQAQTVYQYNVQTPNPQTTPAPYATGYGNPYKP